jgi:hypothetical protein
MTKKILAAVAALAIATGSIVSSAATAEAAAMTYNPSYCVLFLPFLCFPPPPAPHKHKAAHKHYAKPMMAKPMKAKPKAKAY